MRKTAQSFCGVGGGGRGRKYPWAFGGLLLLPEKNVWTIFLPFFSEILSGTIPGASEADSCPGVKPDVDALVDGRVAGHLGTAVGLKTLSIHVCIYPHFGM